MSDARFMNSMMDLARKLPPELIYACAIHVIAYGTTGKYDGTSAAHVSAVEIVKRYMDDKVFPIQQLFNQKESKHGQSTTPQRPTAHNPVSSNS